MTIVTQSTPPRALERSSAPERVLIYGMNYAPEPTGVGRYTGEIGVYLAREGMQIDVVTAVPHYPGWSVAAGYRNRYCVERSAGSRITRCPLVMRTQMRGIWRVLAPLTFALTSAPVAMWRILADRPNVVLCIEPTLFCAPVAVLAARIVGARTILHVQDLEVDAAFAVGHLRGGLLLKLAGAIERAVLRSFDTVVTISNRMLEKLKSKGISQDRLKLVRNWVDLEKIRPLPDASRFRAEIGVSGEKFIALYAGNIGPKQALPVVLEAAAQLVSDTRLVFILAGDGPEKKNLMARFGHLPNVRFLPVQPEDRLCELLNAADVHVLPQDRAAVDLVLPSKLGGMLASGKACIVMASPGTELFEFLGNGAIVLPPGDSAALAGTVRLLASEPGRFVLDSNSARIASLDAKQNLAAFGAMLTGGR